MKKNFLLMVSIFATLMLHIVSPVQAQSDFYNIEFNVDMTDVPDFNPDIDVIHITGSMLGWSEPGTLPTDQLMTRVGSTMIYTKTLQLESGEHQYKYFMNFGWMNGEWPGDPNRVINVVGDASVSNVWGINDNSLPTHTIILNVDMSLNPFFDTENDQVYVTGSFIGWSEPGFQPDDQLMARVGNTMIWTKTLELPYGGNMYKYFINSGWGNGEWQDYRSRSVFIDQNTVFDDYWANCYPAIIPINEGFENSPLWQSPDCWFINGDWDWFIQVSNNQATQGQQSVSIFHNPNSFALLVSPFIDVDLSSLQIGFKALKDWSNAPNAKISVGVMEDPSQTDSFMPLQEFIVSSQPGSPFQQFDFYFSDFTGIAGHIAIKVDGLDINDWNVVYIDDIIIDFIPDCPTPHQLNVSNITISEAQLGWIERGTANQWEIIYGIKGFNPENEGTLIQDLTAQTYLIQGLEHSTNYDFYVRSICDSEPSAWSLHYSFWTECAGEEFTFISPIEGQVIDLETNNLVDIIYEFRGCADFGVIIELVDEFDNYFSTYHMDHLTGSATISHTIELPMTMCSGNYKFRLGYWNNQTFTYTYASGTIFTVINITDNLQIAQPNGWMVALVGQNMEIRWNSSKAEDVSLFYSLDNGQSWNNIAEQVPTGCGHSGWNYNNFNWLIPTTIEGTFDESRIRVERANNPSISFVSPVFRITNVIPIEITTPLQGEIYQAGEQVLLSFTSAEHSNVDVFFINSFGSYSYLETYEATLGSHSLSYNANNFDEG